MWVCLQNIWNERPWEDKEKRRKHVCASIRVKKKRRKKLACESTLKPAVPKVHSNTFLPREPHNYEKDVFLSGTLLVLDTRPSNPKPLGLPLKKKSCQRIPNYVRSRRKAPVVWKQTSIETVRVCSEAGRYLLVDCTRGEIEIPASFMRLRASWLKLTK